jgi:hypothetical protein
MFGFVNKATAKNTWIYLQNTYSGFYLNSQGYPYPLKKLNIWPKYSSDPEQAFLELGCISSRTCIKIQQGRYDLQPNQSPTNSYGRLGYCLNLDYLQVNRPVTLYPCTPVDRLQYFYTVPSRQWNGVLNAEYVRIKLLDQPYCLEPESRNQGALVILTYCGSGVDISNSPFNGNTRQLWKKEYNNEN